MNESQQMINDPKKRMQIFQSLMSVEFHLRQSKTLQETLGELKELESEGGLRVYYPEVK